MYSMTTDPPLGGCENTSVATARNRLSERSGFRRRIRIMILLTMICVWFRHRFW